MNKRKSHIRPWRDGSWFVGWGFNSCVGCSFDSFCEACDFASVVTLKMRSE